MIDHDKNSENSGEKKSEFDVVKHAWNYFELHANQRISLIKLYIVLLSAYITASGYLIIRINNSSNTEEFSLMFLSGIFISVTLIFFLLDRRNRKLIHIAEDSLRAIEKSHYKNEEEEIHRIFVREKNDSDNCCCAARHTTCFTALFIIAIASALFIYFYSWHHSYQPVTCNQPSAQTCVQYCNICQGMQSSGATSGN